MLAQIEGELNAPDRAVEGLVGEFGDYGSGVGSSSSLLPLDDDLNAALPGKPDSYFSTSAHDATCMSLHACTLWYVYVLPWYMCIYK